MGWGKVACWSTKAAIALKRVKIKEKFRANRNSPTLYRTVPSRPPYGLPFPKIGGLQPHPNIQSLLSEERVKRRTSKLARTFTVSIRTKAHQQFMIKGSVGVSIPGTAQSFKVPPIISGTGKGTNFKFGRYIHRVHPNKSPLNVLRKGSVGVSRDCPMF